MLEAVSNPVLSKVVLRIAGTIEMPPLPPGKLVSCEPSPIKYLAFTVPAEMVEKKPKVVDIVNALIFETFSKKLTLLLTVSKLVLIVVTLVLTSESKLLCIPILVSFVADCVETALRLVLTVAKLLLTVSIELLSVRTAPLLGIFVNKEPSPIN